MPATSDPPETTTIYLVRHGRTALNAQGLLRGHLDPPLDDEGVAQAERLGDALAALPVVMVVSSPLRRAIQTATAIARRSGLELRAEERLTDRDYGSWAGRTLEEVTTQFGSIDRAPGVEPRASVEARALLSLEDNAGLTDGRASVMVSHDAVIHAILQALDPAIGSETPLETGCYNELARRDGIWAVVAINQVPT